MNEHLSRYKVEKYVEQLASQPIVKSFNPSAVCKKTNLPLKVVLSYLNSLVDQNKLVLRYEIRCLSGNSVVKKTDNYMEYLGKELYCYYCDDYISVTTGNIFPIYHFNPEYRKVVNENLTSSLKKKRKLHISELTGCY
ncbi:hypothetical protein PRVXT_000664 [Proteinivorax tanatarense]|uniref:Uncharacterized protein n=1 Tax=Proteinivorax tanatarense TaxID=1260629 RepID=A0AAU7VN95_9FIRM